MPEDGPELRLLQGSAEEAQEGCKAEPIAEPVSLSTVSLSTVSLSAVSLSTVSPCPSLSHVTQPTLPNSVSLGPYHSARATKSMSPSSVFLSPCHQAPVLLLRWEQCWPGPTPWRTHIPLLCATTAPMGCSTPHIAAVP